MNNTIDKGKLRAQFDDEMDKIIAVWNNMWLEGHTIGGLAELLEHAAILARALGTGA